MMKIFIFLFGTITSLSCFAKCKYQNSDELLYLILENHPVIKHGDAILEVKKKNVDAAGQRLNPILEAEALSGSISKNNSGINSSLNIRHVFETGGKRKARVEKANGEINIFRESTRDKKEDLFIQIVRTFHAQRNRRKLISAYLNSIETFKKIVSLYGKEINLSPEKKIEREMVFLSISNYELKVAKLRNQMKETNLNLNYFSGRNCEIAPDALPKFSLKKVNKYYKNGERDAKVSLASRNLELKRLAYNLEDSEGIPNIELGPAFESQSAGTRTTYLIGVALVMDLPLLTSNEGGKLKAIQEVSAANIKLNNVVQRRKLDFENWRLKHQSYTKSFTQLPSVSSLEKRLKNVNQLFKRGLVSIPIVLEAHRQLISLNRSIFNLEQGIVESYWNIKKFRGEIPLKR